MKKKTIGGEYDENPSFLRFFLCIEARKRSPLLTRNNLIGATIRNHFLYFIVEIT